MAETQPTRTAATARRPPWIPAVGSFLVVSFLAIVFQITLSIFSPISPHPHLRLPSAAATLPVNDELQRLTKLGEGLLKNPEDVCVDTAAGILYTASRDGWIKRLHLLHNGSDFENWKNFESESLLGIAISKDGGILVCDAQKGLLKVDEDGFSVLVSSIVNQIISFADDVVEAADGNIYLSDASSKFGLHNWYLDFLEAKPYGRLLKYDPSSNQISTLLDNLYFANGVALSKDQTYVLVCETFRYRCVKYWLKGEKEGKMEIFIDNLPGAPDNINLAPDGSFWIALLQPVREGSKWFVRSKMARHILAIFPELYQMFVDGTRTRATVVKVSEDGKIVRKLEDPNGKVISFLTSAVEFQDHLYLGSLNANFIGKLSLTVP